MSTNSIDNNSFGGLDYGFTYEKGHYPKKGYSLTKKEASVAGLTLIVGLSAIIVGVVALKAITGLSIQGIGSIKMTGAYCLIGIGTALMTGSVLYLVYRLGSQYLLRKRVEAEAINLELIFNHLAKTSYFGYENSATRYTTFWNQAKSVHFCYYINKKEWGFRAFHSYDDCDRFANSLLGATFQYISAPDVICGMDWSHIESEFKFEAVEDDNQNEREIGSFEQSRPNLIRHFVRMEKQQQEKGSKHALYHLEKSEDLVFILKVKEGTKSLATYRRSDPLWERDWNETKKLGQIKLLIN